MSKNTLYIVLTIVLLIFGIFLTLDRFGQSDIEMGASEIGDVEESDGYVFSGDIRLVADTASSTIIWKGQRTILTSNVNIGSINLTSGSLDVVDGGISGGEFVVDMGSIALISVHGKGPREGGGDTLLKHLMSDDFFSTERYPESRFTLISAQLATSTGLYTIVGNMTIKGIEREISFPAVFRKVGEKITATSEIVLDRTLWDITYGSSNFFKNIGDQVIGDEFSLTIDMVFDVATSTNGAGV